MAREKHRTRSRKSFRKKQAEREYFFAKCLGWAYHLAWVKKTEKGDR